MEDLPLNNFTIKSSIHDYNVKFINNSYKEINNLVNDGDVIIIDKSIYKLYPKLLSRINDKIKIIKLEANEDQKSYEGLISLFDELINIGFRKNHRLIAIGGGIIQDITAFTASVMYRGVDWCFFPTTLLAQGDSCIGSKTSINFKKFKNQIGGFYPPKNVFIDIDFLKSLSSNDLQSGIGEMCHYFIVAGEEEFNNYKKNYNLLSENKNILSKMIFESLMIKKSYIEIDEFDRKERRIFNYGHSFGHAIESLTNYKIPHGIAVSFGMDIANYVSVKKKILDEKIRIEIREFLQEIWDGYNISNINTNDFVIALSKDKKNIGRTLRLILCKGYGKVFLADQKPDDEFIFWLNQYFSNEL